MEGEGLDLQWRGRGWIAVEWLDSVEGLDLQWKGRGQWRDWIAVEGRGWIAVEGLDLQWRGGAGFAVEGEGPVEGLD